MATLQTVIDDEMTERIKDLATENGHTTSSYIAFVMGRWLDIARDQKTCKHARRIRLPHDKQGYRRLRCVHCMEEAILSVDDMNRARIKPIN